MNSRERTCACLHALRLQCCRRQAPQSSPAKCVATTRARLIGNHGYFQTTVARLESPRAASISKYDRKGVRNLPPAARARDLLTEPRRAPCCRRLGVTMVGSDISQLRTSFCAICCLITSRSVLRWEQSVIAGACDHTALCRTYQTKELPSLIQGQLVPFEKMCD